VPKNIPSLDEYLNRVASAQHHEMAAAPGAAMIAGADAFAAMRDHVLSLYEGVHSVHAFEDHNGSIFDCIPVQEQPSLRGKQPMSPVDLPGVPQRDAQKAEAPGKAAPLHAPLRAGQPDRHGNERHCPEGHIPMRRVRLEEMARFADMRRFLQKSPDGGQFPPHSGGEAPRAHASASGQPAAAGAVAHKYAHAFQSVANLGGHNYINVWQPAIGANQIFSLSQHWYAGGSGGGLQTAEVGWQVYPQKYGNNQPCLFIYWTADDYQTTGCYNLDCTAFVQTSSIWTLGGTLAPVSTLGGTQYELQVAFYLYQGNWWLYLQGTQASNTVGYYPTSIYRGGALATAASSIDYGGETVGSGTWPPMGSGQFAAGGFKQACYQRDIYYFPTGGGATYASLTPSQPSPSCYTINVQSYAAPWNETIFYGGPGGTTC
jgi:Neprosin